MENARFSDAGAHPTPVIDRFYFRSVYFREPSGVLFGLRDYRPWFRGRRGPGHLGESLSLPPAFESVRARVEGTLTPLPYPPAWRREAELP